MPEIGRRYKRRTGVPRHPERPMVLQVVPEGIPVELRAVQSWICWSLKRSDDGWTKVPINPLTGSPAATDNPATWVTFETALGAYLKYRYDGIGLCRTDDLLFVDLDGCRNPDTGTIGSEPWITEILATIESRAYLEASPSGTGIHGVTFGRLPAGRRQWNDPAREHTGFAFYDRNRYFTFTGRVLAGSGPLTDLTLPLHELYAKLFPQRPQHRFNRHDHVTVSDMELIERARRAANGRRFSDLWNGHWDGQYASQSEADLALLCHLAFWTGNDAGRMEQLFQQSGLMRPKWQRRPDYRSASIERAIDLTSCARWKMRGRYE